MLEKYADASVSPAPLQGSTSPAPCITLADIEAGILSEHYFIASDAMQHGNSVHVCPEGGWFLARTQLLTFCVLQLRNGFIVTGESACASAQQFKPEDGRQIARANAIAKLWPLMGYALCSQLAKQP
ncbi:Gp49 family protein [Vogesella mureinivorans]|uniref:Gp49 family protein n=1 Tax=Vogesella mureinivorans TaxID=657276 RepID=UPI0011CBFB91|nr:Gp49 family protein [Vogesella mureinivorans]